MKPIALVPFLLTACIADDPELSETSALVTTFVIEAELATGAGTIEADATASANALRALPAQGATATRAFTTSGTVFSGSVRVRGDACQPWIRLRIDGADMVTTQVTSAAWIDVPFTTTLLAGNHTLELYHRSGGCTLRIDRVTLAVEDPTPPPPPLPAPVIVEAELATGQGTVVSLSSASGNAYRAFAAQYQKASRSFATTAVTTGVVRVRSAGCTAIAKVSVDGSPVLMQSVSGAWQTLALGTFGGGSHVVELEHRSGTCALHFDHATFTAQ